MRIYVVRHGMAIERDDPKCPPEAERYLTAEGVAKTKQVARGVTELGATADLLLSSPYVRAMQTAEIFAGALGYAKAKIRRTDLLLPGADAGLLFRELAKDKDPCTALKKAGVALVELKRVSPPSGELIWLAPPKLLRRAGK